jgi:hypothetical protein
MPGLRLALSVRYLTRSAESDYQPEGALFTQWLPAGEEDALVLTEPDDPNRVAVWYERRAKNRHGFLEWDPEGRDFDVEIMKRQGKLDAGRLKGEFLAATVSDAEHAAIRLNKIEAKQGVTFGVLANELPEYVQLAKRLIKILYPPLSRFIEILRKQYGQYWIQELRTWDSRTTRLGQYCNSLDLKWWSEEDQLWYRFLPTSLGHTIIVQRPPGRGYGEYLTETDWRDLQAGNCRREVPSELLLLGQVSKHLDYGEYRQAFVEAIAGLEIAITRRLSSDGQHKSVRSALTAFIDQSSLKSQAAVVLKIAGVTDTDIKMVIRAIDIRNQVAHEGYSATPEEALVLRQVLRIIATFVGLNELKIPALDSGNWLAAPGAVVF